METDRRRNTAESSQQIKEKVQEASARQRGVEALLPDAAGGPNAAHSQEEQLQSDLEEGCCSDTDMVELRAAVEKHRALANAVVRVLGTAHWATIVCFEALLESLLAQIAATTRSYHLPTLPTATPEHDPADDAMAVEVWAVFIHVWDWAESLGFRAVSPFVEELLCVLRPWCVEGEGGNPTVSQRNPLAQRLAEYIEGPAHEAAAAARSRACYWRKVQAATVARTAMEFGAGLEAHQTMLAFTRATEPPPVQIATVSRPGAGAAVAAAAGAGQQPRQAHSPGASDLV